MAATQIAFGVAGISAPNGGDVPVLAFESVTICTIIVPSGSSQASSAAAPQRTPRPVCRIATDTAVYVTFAETPTATASNGLMIPAGCIDYVACTVGHKAAVIAV
jgi:hypothetical protein